jgi:hypothetical protein
MKTASSIRSVGESFTAMSSAAAIASGQSAIARMLQTSRAGIAAAIGAAEAASSSIAAKLQREANRWKLDFERTAREFPRRQAVALLRLAKHGWYVDSEIGVHYTERLANRLRREDARAAVYEELCRWFEGRIPSITTELCERHPKRAPILRQAFYAVMRGDYAVAIPVLLSQADGICQETTQGRQLYAARERKELWTWLTSLGWSGFGIATLRPLIADTPLTAPKNERRGWESGLYLNRHAILHGEDVEYATRLNACRAASHIAYVDWALCERARRRGSKD